MFLSDVKNGDKAIIGNVRARGAFGRRIAEIVLLSALFLIPPCLSYAGSPLQPILRYSADLMHNVSGGDKNSTELMGIAHAGVEFRSDSTQWWKGGTLHAEAFGTHGRGMSAYVLHDRQVISNIEAGNNPFVIWALWYHQQIGRLGIRAGIQNVNEDFMRQEYADNFSQSSLEVFPTVALNYHLPNYPNAGLGVSVCYDITKQLSLRSSLFDGRVSNRSDDRHNLQWRIHPEDEGLLSVSELKYQHLRNGVSWGTFGLGAVLANTYPLEDMDKLTNKRTNYNLYGFAQLDLAHVQDRVIGVFVQGSIAPTDRNMAYGYLSAGVLLNGFLLPKHTDNIGLAVCNLFYQEVDTETLQRTSRLETAMEVYSLLPINEYVSIKPTVHVVVSALHTTIVAGSLRLIITIF